jgi:hypothetical protein
MPLSDVQDDRAFSGEPSKYVSIARIADGADQIVESACGNRETSHVWSSCMRITPNIDLPSDGKITSYHPNINRISLPIPNL